MGRAGILTAEDRVELLDGEVTCHRSAIVMLPGDDAGPGTEAAPFATIERARDEVAERLGSKSTASPRVGDSGVATCPEMRWHRPRFPT